MIDNIRVLTHSSIRITDEKGLGFKKVTFTTKPSVMQIGYGLYKRMGFKEVSEKDGIVSMKMEL